MTHEPGNIVVGNAENFDNLLSSDTPVLVDFWAEWCTPCRYMEPVLKELAGSFSGRVVFVQLNVDESPAIASKYDVRAIPTFILFRDGRQVKRFLGAVGREPLEAALREALG